LVNILPICKGLCDSLGIRYDDKRHRRFNVLRRQVRVELGEKKCRTCSVVYKTEGWICPCCRAKLGTRTKGSTGRRRLVEVVARY
jgi:hypothetical protein